MLSVKMKHFDSICFSYAICIQIQELNMGYMVNAVIVEKIRYFKEIQLIPDDAYKTGAITQIFSASACLLECSLNDDCQTVVQEDSTCSLYNTTLVTRAKRQEENVLTVIKTETINGKNDISLFPCHCLLVRQR